MIIKQINITTRFSEEKIGQIDSNSSNDLISTNFVDPWTCNISFQTIFKWIFTSWPPSASIQGREITLQLEMDSQTGIEAIKATLINKFGPARLLSDNGRQFVSKQFISFLNSHEIRPIKLYPYNPRNDSLSERINSGIKNILRMNKWTEIITLPSIIYNKVNYTQ